MVERAIRNKTSFPSRRALMRDLPHQVEYRTLVKILQYLEASEKIVFAEDGSIVWVFTDNPRLLKLLDQSPVLSKDTRPSRNISTD
jgi:DNA-binding transcriptional regulator YhcF (GntR family)